MKKLFAVMCILCLAASGAFAADFPTEKALRIVVPYGAGGGVDTAARILAGPASDILGQQVSVVCMAGAGGQEGINFVVKQPHDGYTLLATDYGPLVTTALTEEVNYDLSDWIPLVQITEVIPVFFVTSDSDIKDTADWVAKAKAQPATLSVAHGRHLSVPHLPLILFEDRAGIKNLHVPTTGGSEALAFVLGKKVSIGASVPSTVAATVKAGTIRCLAVAGAARVSTLPDTPTLTELGYDVVLPAWYTVFVHKDTPQDRVKLLEEKFMQALKSDAAKALADKANMPLAPAGVEENAKIYTRTITSLKTVLELANKK